MYCTYCKVYTGTQRRKSSKRQKDTYMYTAFMTHFATEKNPQYRYYMLQQMKKQKLLYRHLHYLLLYAYQFNLVLWIYNLLGHPMIVLWIYNLLGHPMIVLWIYIVSHILVQLYNPVSL